MAEQTFRSPGFFEREIDLSQRESEIIGVPAGIVGTAEMGPAFVPVTVGSFADFERRFGSLDPYKFGPYAVREFFKNRTALTYLRVLGAGSNDTSTDIANTRTAGIVKNAGFKILGSAPSTSESPDDPRLKGCVQFIVADHWISASQEGIGYPIFSDNDSFPNATAATPSAKMVRAMLFTTTGSRFQVLTMASASWVAGISTGNNDISRPNSSGDFKLVLSSSSGASFANDDGLAGIKIYTASLNPSSDNYIARLLNTDPERFQTDEHILYAHFPVENEIASVKYNKTASISLTSGSLSTSKASGGISGLTFNNGFGRFDTRYHSPKTTNFISQPYGDSEYDLFYVETISDGAIANEKFKVSISKVRKSSNPLSKYGTFTLEVRAFDDTDIAPKILESYPLCTLNPLDDDYLAKKVGDFKAFYNFDAELESERKVVVSGKYPNLSSRIRVVMSVALESGEVPQDAMPFGFRGFGALKTSDTLTDISTTSIRGGLGSSIATRMSNITNLTGAAEQLGYLSSLTGSILPPVPFTFKVTRGAVDTSSPAYIGAPGADERVDSRFYWGAKFTRVPQTGSLSNSIFDTNVSSEINDIFKNYAKFLGISKLDNLVTGSGADAFNNNKFTLARVALSNAIENDSAGTPSLSATANSTITGSAKEHILETAYIRNGKVDASNYTVADNVAAAGRSTRLTLASLASLTSSVYFNRFTDYTKFTNFMYGGFDGLNILDTDMARMNDKSTSSDTGGLAVGGNLDIGLSTDNSWGAGRKNSIVSSYRVGARILTDPMSSRVNIILVPGIRDGALTNYVQSRLSGYSKAFYVMDLATYDADSVRLFDDNSKAPSVQATSEQFDGRALDNNYSATYFPDVTIEDPINNRPVKVPSSIAVIGALSYNDNVAYPWFAPAGFNRASLDFVTNVKVRLNQADRNMLYDSRINPIATFPQAGFVIFGQKTLQFSKSALDRVNVRRMLLEVKRLIVDVANKIVFEQNTPETRARFVGQVTPLLATIQSQQGIDQFKVVMDASNNTQEDVENNVLNGRLVLVPTRAVEFIAMDFIITNAGVSFE